MISTSNDARTLEIYGLSTEEKPINKYIGNGSKFIELDTSAIYYFDEEHEIWLKFSSGDGE